MTTEALWYSMHNAEGKPPHCQRVCRLPLAEQAEFAIRLAVGFADGEAGYRKTHISRTGESYWCRNGVDGAEWWLVPPRIERAIFALHEAAVQCEMRRGRGRCAEIAVAARLRAWQRTGHWRQVARECWRRSEIKPPPIPLRERRRRDRAAARIAELRQRHPRIPDVTARETAFPRIEVFCWAEDCGGREGDGDAYDYDADLIEQSRSTHLGRVSARSRDEARKAVAEQWPGHGDIYFLG